MHAHKKNKSKLSRKLASRHVSKQVSKQAPLYEEGKIRLADNRQAGISHTYTHKNKCEKKKKKRGGEVGGIGKSAGERVRG